MTGVSLNKYVSFNKCGLVRTFTFQVEAGKSDCAREGIDN